MAILECKSRLCGHIYCRMRESVLSIKTFFREFLHSPAHVGSVCPSSEALTASMISRVPLAEDGLIIDLGAGSGVVSKQLLHSGVSPERIVALELLSGFVENFQRNCPGVALQIADARDLSRVLDKQFSGLHVSGIISSLPFRVMPSSLVSEILQEVRTVAVKHNAVLVQYSYAWWMRYPLRKYGFHPNSAEIVMKNLPPAKVETYIVQ